MYEVNETTTFIEERAGNETQKFYLLSRYDRLAIIADLRKRRRAELLANLTDAGADTEQKFAELESFDQGWDDDREFIRFVNSAEADVMLPERSLRMDDAAAARKIVEGLRLPAGKMIAFKAALSGLELVTRDPEQAPETTVPNPQIPPTYAKPE